MRADQRNGAKLRKRSRGAELAFLACLFLTMVAKARPWTVSTSSSVSSELQIAPPDSATPALDASDFVPFEVSRKHRSVGNAKKTDASDGRIPPKIEFNLSGNLLLSLNDSSSTTASSDEYPSPDYEPGTSTSSLTTLTMTVGAETESEPVTDGTDTPASTANTESTNVTETDLSTIVTTAADTTETTDEGTTTITVTDAMTRVDIPTLTVPPAEDLKTQPRTVGPSNTTLASTSTVTTTETETTAASTTETLPATLTVTTETATTTTSTTSTETSTPLRTLVPNTTTASEVLTASTIESSTMSKRTTVPSDTETDVTSSADAQPGKDITLLVKIIFKGNWSSVCNELTSIRQSLLKLVNNNVKDNKIALGQIVFHDNHCLPTKLVEKEALAYLLVYIVDENQHLNENLTKALPNFYKNRGDLKFPLPIESFALEGTEETQGGTSTAVIIVAFCAGLVGLLLLAGLFFVMRKRQGHFNYGERCRPVTLDAYNLDNVSAYSSVTRGKSALRFSNRSYGNPTFEDSSAVPSHPLNFAGLASFCNDLSGIANEFSGIPQVSSSIDELPAGAEVKNRYANVIPLPETRVPLQRLNNDPLTEYINANYVQGPKNASKYYIASQAPTEATVCDFWRMIWEQQVKVVVMLTDLVENGVEKCVEYIPPLEVSDCRRLFGDYQVMLMKREPKDKYAISTLQLKNLENNTVRDVYHFWYLWPAKGVPSDASGLIDVLGQARALQRGAASPMLVHCSPGTGRTGTLVALDLVIKQYENTRTVDVPRVVYTIRRNRAGAVQTKEQYTLIYQAINLYASKLAGGVVDSN